MCTDIVVCCRTVSKLKEIRAAWGRSPSSAFGYTGQGQGLGKSSLGPAEGHDNARRLTVVREARTRKRVTQDKRMALHFAEAEAELFEHGGDTGVQLKPGQQRRSLAADQADRFVHQMGSDKPAVTPTITISQRSSVGGTAAEPAGPPARAAQATVGRQMPPLGRPPLAFERMGSAETDTSWGGDYVNASAGPVARRPERKSSKAATAGPQGGQGGHGPPTLGPAPARKRPLVPVGGSSLDGGRPRPVLEEDEADSVDSATVASVSTTASRSPAPRARVQDGARAVSRARARRRGSGRQQAEGGAGAAVGQGGDEVLVAAALRRVEKTPILDAVRRFVRARSGFAAAPI